MSHTPGPWSVDYDDIHNLCVYAADGTWVASLTDNQADAHVIAAAPDLYEALKGFVEDNSWLVSLADQRARHEQRMEAARAALAKAEEAKHE